jgi:hypothetical protein
VKSTCFGPTCDHMVGRIRNDNVVRIVYLATLKNLVVKSRTMFRTETFIDRTGPLLMNRLTTILITCWWEKDGTRVYCQVRSSRRADCYTVHCLVVSKVRKRLTVSQQATQKFDVERFNLRKQNELEVSK